MRSTLTTLFLVAAVGACAESPTALASRDGTVPLLALTSSGGPVTSTVADGGYQITSDGLGSYPNSKTLTSTIQSVGAWVLDSKTVRNGTRQLRLDFGQPIAGSGPNGGDPVAVPTQLYKVRAIAKCNAYGNSMLTMTNGTTVTCPLHIAFDYAGGSYAIQMNPLATGADPDGAPETNPANVSCVAAGTGAVPCSAWTITPSGAGGVNVARLIKYVTSKGKTTNVNQGNFYFSFSIGVTDP